MGCRIADLTPEKWQRMVQKAINKGMTPLLCKRCKVRVPKRGTLEIQGREDCAKCHGTGVSGIKEYQT